MTRITIQTVRDAALGAIRLRVDAVQDVLASLGEAGRSEATELPMAQVMCHEIKEIINDYEATFKRTVYPEVRTTANQLVSGDLSTGDGGSRGTAAGRLISRDVGSTEAGVSDPFDYDSLGAPDYS